MRDLDIDHDWPGIEPEALAFAEQTAEADLLLDRPAAFLGRLLHIFQSPDVDVIVYAHEDKPVGLLAYTLAPNVWRPDLQQSIELCFWVADDAPKLAAFSLLREYERRLEERGVTMRSLVALATSDERVGEVYERMGYRQMETTYTKVK